MQGWDQRYALVLQPLPCGYGVHALVPWRAMVAGGCPAISLAPSPPSSPPGCYLLSSATRGGGRWEPPISLTVTHSFTLTVPPICCDWSRYPRDFVARQGTLVPGWP